MFGMVGYEDRSAYDLSLGQKQRITIAGVLSIKPEVLIMDEPTSMLDPEGKEEIRNITLKLREKGLTIIYITNIFEEILMADRVIILEKR
ncbi:MAG: ATP-binding cassette domain-containing protein [Clostridia bacterium]|jgi:energy-coupling factor transport system ATP-binding protein|nr:ATP-binding cassette domain-containing protein [Clostridia bacterium]